MTAPASRTPSPLSRSSYATSINVGFWCLKHVSALNIDLFTSVTPGESFDSSTAIPTWVLIALLKLVTGILIIFPWRILAKPSQTLLPPLFRWLARASPVRVPHRRHYTPDVNQRTRCAQCRV